MTSLFLAAESGFLNIAERLLDGGAAIDPPSHEGGTPLMAAALAGHLDVVEMLVERGASPAKYMWDGAGPLFLAAQSGHARVVKYLLTLPSIEVSISFTQLMRQRQNESGEQAKERWGFSIMDCFTNGA